MIAGAAFEIVVAAAVGTGASSLGLRTTAEAIAAEASHLDSVADAAAAVVAAAVVEDGGTVSAVVVSMIESSSFIRMV